MKATPSPCNTALHSLRHGIPVKHRIAAAAAMVVLSFSTAQARTWTSADGAKTFEGELKSYDPATGTVGVTLANGSVLKFASEKLSVADNTFLGEQGKVAPDAAPASAGVAIVSDGKAIDLTKPADMTKPVQVFILMGQSNMVGLGKITGAEGSLENAVKTKKLYPYLVDGSNAWVERKDLRFVRMMQGKGLMNNEWMTVASCQSIGPEFGIANPVGNAIETPVMILKSCIGNRSLGWDLLPPGSEPYEFQGKMVPGYRGTPDKPKGDGTKPTAWYAGKQYDDDTEDAKKVLADLDKHYPGGKGYEVAGFFFWQGEKDGLNDKIFGSAFAENYEKNLVAFIKQLRKDFNAPSAKFVLATLGEATKGSKGNGGLILDAQLAVDGTTGKHPEFKGNVATVYSNPLSKGGSGNGHYGGNAETYMEVGQAMGKAMVDLLKSK